jgi:hypothetical protein
LVLTIDHLPWWRSVDNGKMVCAALLDLWRFLQRAVQYNISMKSIAILLVCGLLSVVSPFQPAPINRSCSARCMKSEGEEQEAAAAAAKNGWDPLANLKDMFASVDEVIDDFMGKRMGNGELSMVDGKTTRLDV